MLGGGGAEGFEVGGGAGVGGEVGEVFVVGGGELRREGLGGFADGEMVDVIAESGGDDEGLHGALSGGGFEVAGEGFADLFDGGIGWVHWGFAEGFEGDAEADGGVFEVEVEHVEVVLVALGEGLLDAAEEEFVFAETHGGDVGELVVFVDEGGVGVGGEAAAGEDVEESDGVAGGEPVGDGKREGEGCVVAVRGEDEDLHFLFAEF